MTASRTDSEVRQSVLEALARDARVDTRQVAADVVGQIVILRGLVENNNVKRAVAEAVRRVDGVADVQNLLGVLTAEGAVSRADEEITHEVQEDLGRTLRRDAGHIRVEVRGGTVFLRGEVPSPDQKWLADEVAWWTAGVRDVVNQLWIRAEEGTSRGGSGTSPT